MKVEIYKILGMSKLAYADFVNKQFNDWCMPVANSHYLPQRELLINQQLYNWFITNWDKRIVIPFLIENEMYIMAGVVAPEHYQILFNYLIEATTSIYHIYPSVIIKKIKKAHYDKISVNKQNH